ncbi:PLP-dependent aminotransferase family protein [Arthrobacter sp. I2-34]|uniref:PLP-dependent aminotransferase family protein n=1 Tax=Arthrobacter hankyongi TaxID=2904801 RepID=A0ABS9LB30_9MICC|nr:PLP-dependent aminotransferase family protein [Arthrobacter hankyongi]MCG2623718.1 PLP-dependent aminotransferase family protein [Arthrobacter hankyongi]
MATELPIVLDRSSSVPLTVQLAQTLRTAILDGTIKRDEALPATRALARTLGISRGTVVTAYDQLLGEGYLLAHPRRGTLVSLEFPAAAGDRRPSAALPAGPAPGEAAEPWADLVPGHPSPRGLADAAWKAAWRRAVNESDRAWLPPAAGTAELRRAIAGHLRRARGLACQPSDVIVTAGTSEALLLLAIGLKPEGRALRIAVEDPGYPTARRVLQAAGVDIQGVGATMDGMDPGRLQALDPLPDAVLATPSHQYPLGGRMSVQERADLLAWAAGHGVIVIEDDYDSEFRHARMPLPAMASLDAAGVTVLVGTFSKVLTPWLRCGYLVAFGVLGGRLRRARAALDTPVSGIQQQALAYFIDSGGLARHIARTRREYAHRRQLVLAKLGQLPGVTLGGLDGGLHVIVQFAQPAGPLIAALAERGIRVASLADYSADGAALNGLVIGYGAPSDLTLSSALSVIASLLDGG